MISPWYSNYKGWYPPVVLNTPTVLKIPPTCIMISPTHVIQRANVASKIEMGRFLLHIDAIRNCIKSWQRIQSSDARKILKLTFQNSEEWKENIRRIFYLNMDLVMFGFKKILIRTFLTKGYIICCEELRTARF